MYTQLRFRTLDQTATDAGTSLLSKADGFRADGKPEQWARDVERKALRKFEHSFQLRHLLDRRYPKPEFLPPSAYDCDTR